MSSSPPRVLFVDHTAVLGGAELSLLDIATALRDRSAVALFQDGPFATALVARGVRVIPIAAGDALARVKKSSRVPAPSALVASARATIELARTARSFDLLYANSPKSFLVAAAAGLLTGRRVVWHLRDILSREHFSRANLRLMVRVANRRARCVIANSHATAEAFVASGGRRDITRVVHNGIDPAPFEQLTPELRAKTRDELGIASDAYVVGSFSRLHPWKGQQVLLDALELLPDVHALVVGGALFSGEEVFADELRDRASKPPLDGRVHLLGARSDIPRLMGACDMVAHTSTLPEPFGRVLVEALLADRPLVASDAGGVREVVTHGETALLVPPEDATELAAAIAVFRNDPARAREMAQRGNADVRARFSRTALIAGVARAITDALSEART